MSALSIPMLIFPGIDPFTYALIGITLSMFVIGTWVIPYFDLVLIPTNYPVVAHTPVSSRTYFLVKLTQLLTYTVLLLASLNLIPAVAGIWIGGAAASPFQFLFPLIYLPAAFLSGFFTIGVMMTFAGYLMKFYNKKGLQTLAHYARFIFPTLFLMIMILLPQSIVYLLPSSKGATIEWASAMKWFYLLPNGWFAGIVAVGLGQLETAFLISSGLAVVSTFLLVLFPLRNIARSYSAYLTYMLGTASGHRSEFRVRIPLFVNLLLSAGSRAGFCLGAAYLRRDPRILQQLFSLLASILITVVILIQSQVLSLKWLYSAYAVGLSPGFSSMFCFFGIGFANSLIVHIRSSEHWQAAWLLKLAPLSTPGDLWRGVQATAFLYLIVPFTLVMLCIATVIWGKLGIFYILPGATALLYYVLLYPKPRSGLPLAEEFVQKQAAVEAWMPFIYSVFGITAFVGIQYVAYLLNIWVYFGIYGIMVAGGVLGCIYLFTKK